LLVRRPGRERRYKALIPLHVDGFDAKSVRVYIDAGHEVLQLLADEDFLSQNGAVVDRATTV
jgi:hypothetical protein